ncbi:glycosyltransferase [Streptomyces roseus]|uniref:glycosyltransferase n=1 Tax=Streptomyces roseus TaxID=66430 RepID=UPI00368B6462
MPSSPRTRKRRAAWRCFQALPNTDVRRLQRALAQRRDYSCWYDCPSTKEEYGIAVLEAMDARLPVACPRRGGAAHNLRDQVNGLLMDAFGEAGMMRCLRWVAVTPSTTGAVVWLRAGSWSRRGSPRRAWRSNRQPSTPPCTPTGPWAQGS